MSLKAGCKSVLFEGFFNEKGPPELSRLSLFDLIVSDLGKS